jgi:integral membrane protein (TIGR01906 family)
VIQNTWPRLVHWLLVLLLPVFLLVASVHIVTSHWFVRWEYGGAAFPRDPFGLSTTERADLAEVCVDYLAQRAGHSLLADLQLSDGSAAFNERELSHMADVQAVYSAISDAGAIGALVWLAGLGALTASRRTRWRAPTALTGGGLLTFGFLCAVGLFMALSWDDFFTAFHGLFFEDGTWTFAYSDTLIRLFPIRFWMDAAGTIVALLVVQAVAAIVVGQAWRRLWHRDGTGSRSPHPEA